jgi:hypothetical protein
MLSHSWVLEGRKYVEVGVYRVGVENEVVV